MSEWQETTLSKIAHFRNGKALNNSFYTDTGSYAVWGSNGQIARTDSKLCDPPVVVIGRVGAYCGSVAMVESPCWVTDNAIIAQSRQENDTHFLYYLLKHLQIAKTAIGSAQPLLTQSGLNVIRCRIPPLSVQERIAEILGSLDEKIELNRRTSATLEQMAQALFRSWFVDFDPVKAKAAGKRPKNLAPEIFRLFPKEFEDSPLGPIPKGWAVGGVGDYVESVSITHRFPENQIVFLNTSDILDGEVLVHEYSEVATLPGQAKKSIQRNDILYSEIRPANKRHAFIDFDADDYVVSTKLMVLRATSRLDNLVVYYYLKSEPIIRELQRLAESRSGTFPQITFDIVKVLPLVLPPPEIMQIFTTILRDIFNKTESCKSESRTLSALRDTLLPKLMSGELEV